MASAGCNFVKTAGPFVDEIPGKKIYFGRMSFGTTLGYDRLDLPRVHGGAVGSRPQDVFDGCIFIEQLICYGSASEADNAQAGQPAQGTGGAKAEFQIDTQRIKLFNVGTYFNVTVLALNQVEMATDVAAPFPLTSMAFECKVICGA